MIFQMFKNYIPSLKYKMTHANLAINEALIKVLQKHFVHASYKLLKMRKSWLSLIQARLNQSNFRIYEKNRISENQ